MAKMHQNRFRLGLRPPQNPLGSLYSAAPDSLDLRGLHLRDGRGGKGKVLKGLEVREKDR